MLYIKLLSIVLISLLCSYLVGYIYQLAISLILQHSKKINNNISFQSLFTHSTVGYLIIILLYSIIVANFKTINILLIPILLFYSIYIIPHTDFSSYKIGKTGFFYLLLFIIFFYTIEYFSIYDIDSIVPKNLFMDYLMSSRVSYLLNLGFENIQLVKNYYIENKFNEPYHYGELWGNALLYRIFNINPSICLLAITHTLLNTILFLGVLSIYERIYNLLKLKYFLCLLLFFFSTCFLSNILPKDFNLVFGNYDIDILINPKFSLTAIILIFTYLNYQVQKKFYVINLILFIPILNSISLVSIYMTVGIYYILHFLIFKPSKSVFIRNFIFVFINGLLFIVFYYVLTDHVPNNTSEINYREIIFRDIEIKRFIVPIILGLCSVFYAPSLLYCTYKNIVNRYPLQKFSDYDLFHFSILFSAIFCLTTFYYMVDARQLFQIPYIIYLYIVSIIVSIHYIKRKFLLVATIFFGITSMYYTLSKQSKINGNYSPIYRTYLYDLFKDTSIVFLSLKDDNDIKSLYQMNANLSYPGIYAVQTNPNALAIPFYNHELDSVKLLTVDSLYQKEVINRNFESFYRGKFNIKTDSQYINSFDIQYIFTSKSVVLPNNLYNKYRLLISDKSTGEKLYIKNTLN